MRAFLENPFIVLWLTLIVDLADPGTLAIFHFWQNGTFEPLHEIQIFWGGPTGFEK